MQKLKNLESQLILTERIVNEGDIDHLLQALQANTVARSLQFVPSIFQVGILNRSSSSLSIVHHSHNVFTIQNETPHGQITSGSFGFLNGDWVEVMAHGRDAVEWLRLRTADWLNPTPGSTYTLELAQFMAPADNTFAADLKVLSTLPVIIERSAFNASVTGLCQVGDNEDVVAELAFYKDPHMQHASSLCIDDFESVFGYYNSKHAINWMHGFKMQYNPISIYCDISMTIDASIDDGEHEHFTVNSAGEVVLLPGRYTFSTTEQLLVITNSSEYLPSHPDLFGTPIVCPEYKRLYLHSPIRNPAVILFMDHHATSKVCIYPACFMCDIKCTHAAHKLVPGLPHNTIRPAITDVNQLVINIWDSTRNQGGSSGYFPMNSLVMGFVQTDAFGDILRYCITSSTGCPHLHTTEDITLSNMLIDSELHVYVLFSVAIHVNDGSAVLSGQVHHIEGQIITLPPAAYTFAYSSDIHGYTLGTHIGIDGTTSTFVNAGITWTIQFAEQLPFSMHVDTTLQPYVQVDATTFSDKAQHLTLTTSMGGSDVHSVTVETPSALRAPTTTTHDAALQALSQLSQFTHVHTQYAWTHDNYTFTIDANTIWSGLSSTLVNTYHIDTPTTITYSSSANEVYAGDVVFAVDSHARRVSAHLTITQVDYTSVGKKLTVSPNIAHLTGMDVQLCMVVPQMHTTPGLSFVQVLGDDIPAALAYYSGVSATALISAQGSTNRQFDLHDSVSSVSLTPPFTEATHVRVCTSIISEHLHTDPHIVIDGYPITTPTPTATLLPPSLHSFTPDIWLNEADVSALDNLRWSFSSASSLFEAFVELQSMSTNDAQVDENSMTHTPHYFVVTGNQISDPVSTHAYSTSQGNLSGAWHDALPAEYSAPFTSIQMLSGVNLMSIYEHINVRVPMDRNLFIVVVGDGIRTSDVMGAQVTGANVLVLQRVASVYRLTNAITHPLPAYQSNPSWLSPHEYNVVMIINHDNAITDVAPAETPTPTPTHAHTPAPAPTPTPSIIAQTPISISMPFTSVSFPTSLTNADYLQVSVSATLDGVTSRLARLRCFPSVEVEDLTFHVLVNEADLEVTTYTTFLPGVQSIQLIRGSALSTHTFAIAAQTQRMHVGNMQDSTELQINIALHIP